MKPSLNASAEAIIEAERALGVTLPEELKQVWAMSNGLDYPQDWRIYPVFDKSMPRKSWGHIVEENKRSAHDYMQADLLKIASDSYGNHLVLKMSEGIAGKDIFFWDHETANLQKSSITLLNIQAGAKKRVEDIEKKMARGMKKKR
ncbi:SMI1/KNR4 family protein [bacterium]|nr:SMI1/KNR4 family protein [bacterium]